MRGLETSTPTSRNSPPHLYLHTPFCAKVCPYCSFYVHGGGVPAQEKFVEALVNEIHLARSAYDLRPRTIFMGGGTPSMLKADYFRRIAEALPPRVADPESAVEFTIEVNPATVTEAKAQAWREAGVNRISLGAQSFDSALLKLLGRQHKPADIPTTVEQLRAFGFPTINIDLMFALPGQPEANWLATLDQALACHPDSISCYALTYEQDTPFFEKLTSGQWHITEEDREREARLFKQTAERLAQAGLPAYEISNFARPSAECRHNQGIWRGEDYLGLGPSAVSTVAGQRWRNIAETARYSEWLAQIKIGGEGSASTTHERALEQLEEIRTERETLELPTQRRERILLGLRTREGIALSLLDEHGTSKNAADLLQEGLVETISNRLVLTAAGRLVADSVTEALW